jgi:hypothetical protein
MVSSILDLTKFVNTVNGVLEHNAYLTVGKVISGGIMFFVETHLILPIDDKGFCSATPCAITKFG